MMNIEQIKLSAILIFISVLPFFIIYSLSFILDVHLIKAISNV